MVLGDHVEIGNKAGTLLNADDVPGSVKVVCQSALVRSMCRSRVPRKHLKLVSQTSAALIRAKSWTMRAMRRVPQELRDWFLNSAEVRRSPPLLAHTHHVERADEVPCQSAWVRALSGARIPGKKLQLISRPLVLLIRAKRRRQRTTWRRKHMVGPDQDTSRRQSSQELTARQCHSTWH